VKGDCTMGLLYDGRHYDLRTQVAEDMPFWINMANKYGTPVLELGCGTGRVSITLAKAGFQVTGMDISDSMLAEARGKSSREGVTVEWVKADMRHFDLGEKFSLVILPLSTVCHLLDLADFEACLSGVKRHLRPGGGFIVEVFNPRLDVLVRDPGQRYPYAEYPDPDGRGTIVVTQSSVYDRATQVVRTTLFFELPGQVEEIADELTARIYFPQELDALLKYNGFTIEAKLGEYDATPFTSASPLHIAVCRLLDCRLSVKESRGLI